MQQTSPTTQSSELVELLRAGALASSASCEIRRAMAAAADFIESLTPQAGAVEDAEWLRSLVPFLEAHHCDAKRLERIASLLNGEDTPR